MFRTVELIFGLTMFRPIRIRTGSANLWPYNTPSVLLKHTRHTVPFQPVVVLEIVITISYADPHYPTSLRGFAARRSGQQTLAAHRLSPCMAMRCRTGVTCGPFGEPDLRQGFSDGVLHLWFVQVMATFFASRGIDPSVSAETTRSQRVSFATRTEED